MVVPLSHPNHLIDRLGIKHVYSGSQYHREYILLSVLELSRNDRMIKRVPTMDGHNN